MSADLRPLAIGLVHHRAGTPAMDRTWARALVIHYAASLRLQLLDILETVGVLDGDDPDVNRERIDSNDRTLQHLAQLASTTGAQSLVTVGVPLRLAQPLAAQVGLQHEPVLRPHPGSAHSGAAGERRPGARSLVNGGVGTRRAGSRAGVR